MEESWLLVLRIYEFELRERWIPILYISFELLGKNFTDTEVEFCSGSGMLLNMSWIREIQSVILDNISSNIEQKLYEFEDVIFWTVWILIWETRQLFFPEEQSTVKKLAVEAPLDKIT